MFGRGWRPADARRQVCETTRFRGGRWDSRSGGLNWPTLKSIFKLEVSRLAVALVALLVSVSAGAPRTPPQATAVDAQRANVELAELQQGRKLLLGKCAGCHRTPMPNDYRPVEWPKQMDEMAPKARLDIAQRALIEKYLVTMSTKS